MKFLIQIWLLPRNIAVAIMMIYRKIVSPLYGQVCRYYPSCSFYALQSYKSLGFIRGTFFTAWRLLRCNPWTSGGIDDPPPLNTTRYAENKYGFVVAKSLE